MDREFITVAMPFDPNWTLEAAPPTALIKTDGQHPDLLGFEIPDWARFDLEPLPSHAVEGNHTFLPSSSPQPPAELPCPPLSPPTPAECPPSPSTQPPSTPSQPVVEGLSGTPLTILPRTTPPPPMPQTSDQARQFDFCPFTRRGEVCGYVSWARSSNKQIKRHMKTVHFPDTSLGYECPNTRCTHKGFRFLRKDACAEHRRSCDLEQAPGYNPPPHIVSGSDTEANRWMKARCKQRRDIIKKFIDGAPWDTGLLQPVNI